MSSPICLQTARFRHQLVSSWMATLKALTTLSVHSNRDVRTAAADALSACLQEVRLDASKYSGNWDVLKACRAICRSHAKSAEVMQ